MTDKPSIDTSKVSRVLQRLARRSPQFAKDVRILTAEGILGEAASQDSIPIKTGALQSSGTIIDGRNSTTIGFNTNYAAAVHETHKTKPFFLRDAINKHGKRIVEAAARITFRKHAKQSGLTDQ